MLIMSLCFTEDAVPNDQEIIDVSLLLSLLAHTLDQRSYMKTNCHDINDDEKK